MHSALAFHGIDTRLMLLENQGHDVTRNASPPKRLARYGAMTDWFAKYLQP